MAQTAELPLTTTDGDTSTGFAVASGQVVTVGMYTASGEIPEEATVHVLAQTPGADLVIGELRKGKPIFSLTGPLTLCKLRMTSNGRENTAVGAFLDA